MRLQPRSARADEKHAAGQSQREVSSTPAFRQFLARPDLQKIVFPSGNIYIFLRSTGVFGSGYTLADAVRSAISNELLEVSK